MNTNQLIPFFMVFSAPKERQSRLAEAMIPALIPVAPAQRTAVAAISATIQADNESRRHDMLGTEAVNVIKILVDKSGNKLILDELASYPNFKKFLDAHTDLRDKIVAPAQAQVVQAKS